MASENLEPTADGTRASSILRAGTPSAKNLRAATNRAGV